MSELKSFKEIENSFLQSRTVRLSSNKGVKIRFKDQELYIFAIENKYKEFSLQFQSKHSICAYKIHKNTIATRPNIASDWFTTNVNEGIFFKTSDFELSAKRVYHSMHSADDFSRIKFEYDENLSIMTIDKRKKRRIDNNEGSRDCSVVPDASWTGADDTYF